MKWLKEGKTSGSQFELVEIFLWATANWASPLIRTFTCNGQQIEIIILKTNQSDIHINKMTLLRPPPHPRMSSETCNVEIRVDKMKKKKSKKICTPTSFGFFCSCLPHVTWSIRKNPSLIAA